MLSVVDSEVGEVVEGWLRITGLRPPSEDGGPYNILEIDDRLEGRSWAWLRGDNRVWWSLLQAGDAVWLSGKVSEVWSSGARDLEVLEIRDVRWRECDTRDSSWIDEPGVEVDLPHPLALHLLGIIQRALSASDQRVDPIMEEQIRGLALFLADALSRPARS